jgi:hypothetical protein
VAGRLKDNWSKLSRRNRMILSGAALACLALFVILAGLSLMRPSAPVSGLLAPTSAHGEENTPTPAAPGAKPTYPAQPAATSEWTLLPSSAPIRPGIYVKVVRPNGFDMFKEAGFDKDFITTLSSGKILYVLQGPVRADTLSWIKVSDGVTVGWGVQDHVIPYGIKNAP